MRKPNATDEQILEEYKKCGFTMETARRCRADRKRVIRIAKKEGLI
jgi:hypothetical protein